MNSTPALQLPRRGLRSLVLVILIHVLIIWGLSSGLARDIVKKVVPPRGMDRGGGGAREARAAQARDRQA